MSALRAGLLLALVSTGCLPRTALTRREALEADRYAVAYCLDAEAADPLPPARWCLTGTVDRFWVRTFRDGTHGEALIWSDTAATLAVAGVDTPLPPPLDGAVLELRRTPSGRVVAVDGVAGWTGPARGADRLDLLWPLFAPELPDVPAGGEARTDHSLGLTVPGLPLTRTRWRATWTTTAAAPGEAALHATVRLERAGEAVGGPGELEADWRLERRTQRVEAVTAAGRRTLRVELPGGTVEQPARVTVDVRRVGVVTPPALGRAYVADDPYADAAPVQLADGREAIRTPVDARVTLPWVVVAPADAEALRERFFPTPAAP